MILRISHLDKEIVFSEEESLYLLSCFDEVGDLFLNEEKPRLYFAILEKLNGLPDFGCLD